MHIFQIQGKIETGIASPKGKINLRTSAFTLRLWTNMLNKFGKEDLEMNNF